MSDDAVRFELASPPPPATDWPRPLDFRVPAGEFCVVVATPAVAWALLRLTIGLREPVTGRVEVLGTEPGRLTRWDAQVFRRRLGVGFGEPAGLISNLTLRMNVIVPLLYSGAATLAKASRRADETLDAAGLTRWADDRPADVSPDVRRAAVIARAIARDPELLLLENPLASLREPQAARLLSLCRQRARTVLAVTTEHDPLLLAAASMVARIEETGLRMEHHEVGTL